MYPPPEGDLPREQLIARAEKVRRETNGADIHFKYTCEACGERCMLAEPNTLYESGECHACLHVTKITHGGFAIVIKA